MRVSVIEPPELVVSADEAREARVFTPDDDDDYVEMLLDIAQSEVDGPSGWLGRSIGEQVLEITVPGHVEVHEGCLPYPPIIDILSNEMSDDQRDRVVRYRAGQPIDEVPRRMKHAIILMAGALRDATPNPGGILRRESVDGLGSMEYSLPDGAGEAMKAVADRLLETYRVFA